MAGLFALYWVALPYVLIKCVAGRYAKNESVQGYYPQGETKPGKGFEITFQDQIGPVPEGLQVEFFNE